MAPIETATPDVKNLSTVAAVGVDIGFKRDRTTIATVEPEKVDGRWRFVARRLNRLPERPEPSEVGAVVGETVTKLHAHLSENHERIRQGTYPGPPSVPPPTVYLRVDATGVGYSVLEPISEAIPDHLVGRRKRLVRLEPVYFNHGDRLRHTEEGVSLGKLYLVYHLKTLISSGRLHLPRGMREAEEMAKELLDFDRDVDKDANERYGAFKVGTHDDLVTALGLAVMEAPKERRRKLVGRWEPPKA